MPPASALIDDRSLLPGIGLRAVTVDKHAGGFEVRLDDLVPVEEPLEIRLAFTGPDGARSVRALAVTMRTPGDDEALALGFLLTEGLLHHRTDIERTHSPATNIIQVEFATGATPDLRRLERNFYTSSSCGVCGKTSLAAVRAIATHTLMAGRPQIAATLVPALPGGLRAAQHYFDHTGGIHAAGLFDAAGNVRCVHEDVGRHNAVDKVVGTAWRSGWLPASDDILLVSGRASFELVQKAVLAGIPVLAAVGAPSSLAVSLAEEAGLTLLGFVRPERFNVYAGAGRIQRNPT